jgi:SAM-dependent methyltransferase
VSLKSFIPWHTKIAAKVILSRLPAGYDFWHKLDLFSHGSMDLPEYAHQVFSTHFGRSDFARKRSGFVAMEIGPGDSALSAIIAPSYGATACYLVDAGRFATDDMHAYRNMPSYLASLGRPAPEIGSASNLDGVLAACNARYLTDGLASLRTLPTASVDFMWSQAVLEHVRRDECLPTMRELRRILRPDGICSHRVDLKDHLGGALNNMRLPSDWWEKEWMARSGFYTNRLRFSEMIRIFEEAGFSTEVVGVSQWQEPPIRRQSLAREFRQLSDADLRIKEFDVLLRHA